MNFIFAYETPGERMARRARHFLRWFNRRKEWHLPISGVLFLAGFVENWDHAVHRWEGVMWCLFGLYAACWAALLAARAVHQPYSYAPPSRVGKLLHVLDGFCILPSAFWGQGTADPRYGIRFMRHDAAADGRLVPNDVDLGMFVEFGDRALGGAHPEMGAGERRALYVAWWTRRRDAFLILERLEGDGRRRVIAVSIVLPLGERGRSALCDGHIPVSKLGDAEIASNTDDSRCLLLDTLIVPLAYRHRFSGYAFGLVLKHLSLFWDPREMDPTTKGERQMTILVEPDVESVARLARLSGFSGPRITPDKGRMYSISFPDPGRGDELEKRLELVKGNVVRFRDVPVVGNG
jgi:hypothetical protein